MMNELQIRAERLSMFALCVLTLSLVSALIVRADPSAEAQQFLSVPEAEWHYKNDLVRDLAASAMPPGLLRTINSYDWGTNDGVAPMHLRGFTLDLNKDGKPEYFLVTVLSGSGGPNFMILTDTGHEWKVVGNYQGILHVMRAAHGWPKLVTTLRGGGENFAKVYLEFRNGGYEQTAIERFERGTVTKDLPER